MKYKCQKCKKLFSFKNIQSWNICSDGNKLRYICNKCDIELNEVVLKFMGFRNWKAKIKKYKESFK